MIDDHQPAQHSPSGDAERGSTPSTPYYLYLGLEIVDGDPGSALVRLPHRPELTNSRGEIHGGVQGSILDVALSQAIRSALPPGSRLATITLATTHLAAGHGSLTAYGRVIRAGRSVATAEGYIEDADGQRVAVALGTFRVWLPAPSPGSRERHRAVSGAQQP